MSLARIEKLREELAQVGDDIEARHAIIVALEETARVARVAGERFISETVRGVITEDEQRRSAARSMEQAKAQAQQAAKKAEHFRKRPERWAALTPSVRAAYRAAEVSPASMRKAFFAFAEALSGDETGPPSAMFEPEGNPATQAEEQAEAYARHSAGLSAR